MTPVNPRQFGVGFRANYLRRWLLIILLLIVAMAMTSTTISTMPVPIPMIMTDGLL